MTTSRSWLKIAAVGLGVASSVAMAQAQELRIGTASQGGAFYPVGQAISTLVGNHSDGLTMVPVVTQGSVQNPRLVNTGEVDVAITNNNLSVLANKGVGPYKKSGAMNLRALGSLHFSVLHMMTLDGSEINAIPDLKGKRVAVGPAGGGTIPFLTQVLGLHGLSMDDIDLFEVNEAFGSVPLSWAKAMKADLAKLNVNGGAQALGHPLGGTGAKLMTTLVHELHRSGKRYGLLAICEGGGTANGTIVERVEEVA